jgi:hypothetical protein
MMKVSAKANSFFGVLMGKSLLYIFDFNFEGRLALLLPAILGVRWCFRAFRYDPFIRSFPVP